MSPMETIEEFMEEQRQPVCGCDLDILDALNDLQADVQYLENAVLGLTAEMRGRR